MMRKNQNGFQWPDAVAVPLAELLQFVRRLTGGWIYDCDDNEQH